MKIITRAKDLKAAVEEVMVAVPAKSSTPILPAILFKAQGSKLELQGNNFTTAVKAEIAAEVETAGTAAVSGKNFAEVVNKLSGNIVTLETGDDNFLTLKSDATKFELFTMDAEDYPEFSFENPTFETSLPAATFKYLVKYSTFAVADEKDGRPVFQGVNFVFDGNKIMTVATNTHRLIAANVGVADGFSETKKIIIPANVLESLARIMTDDNLIFKTNDKAACFEFKDFKLSTRLIDGTFPPHDRIIPASCETSATVDAKELAGALNRAEIIAKQSENNTVKLKFDNEGLELVAESYETGRVVEHLLAEVEGGDIDIAFNLRYIKEFLKVAGDSDDVKIGMNENLSPAVFRIPTDDNIIYIITPVRTS